MCRCESAKSEPSSAKKQSQTADLGKPEDIGYLPYPTATDRDEQVAFAEASTIEHCDSLYSHLFEHANDARLQTTILCLLELEFAEHQAQYGQDIAPDSMLADLLQACDQLPLAHAQTKQERFAKLLNEKGIFLVTELLSKYELMIVATMSLSSTLR